jgi:AcrR family transcriptional regulator
VLDTTLAMLTERGYAFSVDDVASEAEVHKTTIYRHWPTKAGLVAAAVERLATTEVKPRSTGDPVSDLTHLALDVARALRTDAGSGTLRAALAAAADDPELVSTARTFLTGRYKIARDIIRRGIDTGVVRADIDPTLLWESIVNPLHIRALLGTAASDQTARRLVDLALRGAASGPGEF